MWKIKSYNLEEHIRDNLHDLGSEDEFSDVTSKT